MPRKKPSQSTIQNVPVITEKPAPQTQTIAKTPPPEPAPEQETPRYIDTETLNAAVRPAIVNIFCRAPTASGMSSITASGVIIDSRGVVLANAHVGQFFLLEKYHGTDFVRCQVRTGSPARATYAAELLYVSPEWVQDNASAITQEDPLGTGEGDFALVRITHALGGASVPGTFPTIRPERSISEINANTPILIASYPAGFLKGMSVENNLSLVSTVSVIDQVLSFKSDPPLSIDLLGVSGSIGSQQGSSGGALVSFTTGELLGIIVTATLDGSTAERELRAITYPYIAENFARQAGESIDSYLSGNLAAKAAAFNRESAPTLSKLLFDQIEKN